MWSAEERLIFQLPDKRLVDPQHAYRVLLVKTNGELNSLLAQYQEGEMGEAVTAGRLAAAAVAAFDLPPFDQATGQGTLEDEALNVLSRFLAWRDQKKTTTATPPTSPPPTARVGSQ